jgi:DNA-binding transcriptional ArsR family regulator
MRALASDRRLRILDWLKDPERHFPPQVDGDLRTDGVCAVLLARKLRISQPSLSEHMRILSEAGLVRSKRIKQWTFYRRDEARIRELKRLITRQV